MDNQRFKSIKRFSRDNGVPENLIRKEVRQKLVPGFYSGSWFYIDAPAYLEMLSARNMTVSVSE